jgi:hypothetical protein
VAVFTTERAFTSTPSRGWPAAAGLYYTLNPVDHQQLESVRFQPLHLSSVMKRVSHLRRLTRTLALHQVKTRFHQKMHLHIQLVPLNSGGSSSSPRSANQLVSPGSSRAVPGGKKGGFFQRHR